MLREITITRQHAGEPRRRWFYSPEQDLYVWYDDQDDIVAFQLCYAKSRNERALYWKAGAGFSHLRVDNGGGSGFSRDTPILRADGAFDGRSVLPQFLALAADLPSHITAFVQARIDEFSGIPAAPER